MVACQSILSIGLCVGLAVFFLVRWIRKELGKNCHATKIKIIDTSSIYTPQYACTSSERFATTHKARHRSKTATQLHTFLSSSRLDDSDDGSITPKAHELVQLRSANLVNQTKNREHQTIKDSSNPHVSNDQYFSYAQQHRATNVSLLAPMASYAFVLEGMSEIVRKKARFGRWKARKLKLTSAPSCFVLVRSACAEPMYSLKMGAKRTSCRVNREDNLTKAKTTNRTEKQIPVLSIRPGSITAYTRLKTARTSTTFQTLSGSGRRILNKRLANTSDTSPNSTTKHSTSTSLQAGRGKGGSSVTRSADGNLGSSVFCSARCEALVSVHQLWHFETECGRRHTFRSSSQRQAMSWCNALRQAIAFSNKGLDRKKIRAMVTDARALTQQSMASVLQCNDDDDARVSPER